MKHFIKVFTKDSVCECSNIKDAAAAFVNRVLAYGMILDDMTIDDDKIVIKYHTKEIDNEKND